MGTGKLTEDPKELRILATGGGTGGHAFPALATIAALQRLVAERGIALRLLYLGNPAGVEARMAAEAGIPFAGIKTGKLRRSSHKLGMASRQNAFDLLRVPAGIAQSWSLVRRFSPHAALATGGYVSVPPIVAAGMLRIPALAHEQTAQIGLANKIAFRFAARIALSTEESLEQLPPRLRGRAIVTGNPVRDIVLQGQAQRAREALGWTDEIELPVVFITGGAQGAKKINAAVEEALPQMLLNARVIHQCGAAELKHFEQITQSLPADLRKNYRPFGFIGDEIGDIFALADLVVGRSGAGTVNDVSATGKAAIYSPLLPTSGDEQTRNAERATLRGAALIVPQPALNGDSLWSAMEPLLRDPEQRRRMGDAARTLARPCAARDLAEELLGLALRSHLRAQNEKR